jgi:hypothetical protein
MGESDAIQTTPNDPLEVLMGQVTRLRLRGLKRLSMDFFEINRLRWTSRG